MLDIFLPSRESATPNCGAASPAPCGGIWEVQEPLTSSPRVACLYVFPLTTILLAKAQFAESPEDGTQRAGWHLFLLERSEVRVIPPPDDIGVLKSKNLRQKSSTEGGKLIVVFPRYGVLLRVRQDRGHHRLGWCKEICPTRSECVAGIVNCCLRLVIRGLP